MIYLTYEPRGEDAKFLQVRNFPKVPKCLISCSMKCKPTDPEKFKEGGRVRIHAWLGVVENYLHAGNTSPDFWVDIAQTYLEVRVAQNWQNTMKVLERERGKKS